MAARTTAGLPSPQTDLHARKLPLKIVKGRIYRIHRSGRECLSFSKNASGRFDDPLKEYGILYASREPEGALAEVFLRRLSMMLVREAELQERSISEIVCAPLHCVDLTGAGLRIMSGDNRVKTEVPYLDAGEWSRLFFTHAQHPDGILYRSRHHPRFKCLGLFDRCQSKLNLTGTEELMSGARRNWTIGQISKYRLALEPVI